GNQPQVKARPRSIFAARRRHEDAANVQNHPAIQATNMAQGSGMKRASGTAARCNEFFLASVAVEPHLCCGSEFRSGDQIAQKRQYKRNTVPALGTIKR